MSAPRGPSAEQPFLAQPMRRLTAALLRRPWTTLAVAGVLTVLCLLLTVSSLGYKTSRLDLLDPESDYNRLWIDYLGEFGKEEDAVVVVEGPSREQVQAAIDDVASLVASEPKLFRNVLHVVDLGKLRNKGLHYVSPDELAGVEQFVAETSPIVEGQWTRLGATQMAAGLSQRLHAELQGHVPDGLRRGTTDLTRFCNTLLGGFYPQSEYQSPWPSMESSLSGLGGTSREYLLTRDGRMGFVLLHLDPGNDEFAPASEATDELRRLLEKAEQRHVSSEIKIGLTGLPVMENDEMRASQSSMMWASIVSFIAVGMIFIAGFGGLRHALMANMVLLVGMAWAFGYVTLAIGHLNILSVSFAVTLIGIGIDYGVYYVARYMKTRDQYASVNEALLETTTAVGPAIVAGAVTTAIAFLAAGLTSFAGVAELGIIAGGGIVLCAIAQLFVLPVVIQIVDTGRWGAKMPRPLPVDGWVAPLMRRPRVLLAVTLLVTVGVAGGLERLWYDHNLLNMQAKGQESIELEYRLLEGGDQSMWYAISMADSREELLERAARFSELGSVERVEEIVSVLPPPDVERSHRIARIHQRLASLPQQAQDIPVDSPANLATVLRRAQALAFETRDGSPCVHRIDQVLDALARMPEGDAFRALAGIQQRIAADLLTRLGTLREVSSPAAPTFADLPPSLVSRFVGKNGRHLMKVYGRGNIWDMEALSAFVHDVRSIDPRATGNPLQAYEASLEMKTSYEHAAMYAIVIIFAILLFDFRSPKFALLAALPLAVGMVLTFGMLGYLNIPLNPANMIALPLIMGIGVDYGVHMVHEFREQTGRYRISAATAVAVLVDALTTIVGFGSLMVATHQGLQSLGRVLSLGITCCTFASMIMLPALFTLMTRHRPDDSSSDAVADTSEEAASHSSDELEDIQTVPSQSDLIRPRRREPLPAA